MKKGETFKTLTCLQQSAMHGALELLQGNHREPSPEWEAQAVRVIYELGAALSAEPAPSAEYQSERLTSVSAQNQGEIVMQWSDDGLIWCDGEEHEIASARCEGYTTRILYRAPPEQPQGKPVGYISKRALDKLVTHPMSSACIDGYAMYKNSIALYSHTEQQPPPISDGTTSDKYRAELYDEVWQRARDMGFENVTEALAKLKEVSN